MARLAPAVAVAALLVYPSSGSALARKPRIDKSMETDGVYSKIDKPAARVIDTPEQWAALWKDLGKPAPSADLEANFGVAVFAGTRNSGGYGIVFDKPKDEGGKTVVRYAVTEPKGMAIMALTQPWAVRLFPRTGKPVVVEERRP